MRTETVTYNIYTYSELSDKAKEKVKQNFLEGDFRNECFQEDLAEDLKIVFPNSDLNAEYSLGYCQGDGLNIYGRIAVEDIITILTDKKQFGNQFEEFWNIFSESEIESLREYNKHVRTQICSPQNWRYHYCKADAIYFAIIWAEELAEEKIKYDFKIISKFEFYLKRIIESYCSYQEKTGYEYIYNISDEEMEDLSSCNEWEYYEDGRRYNANEI